MDSPLWWRDGIIYQIYPRSFADSNGDGLGDLPGIISRLDYLAALGVDAIWLSPFYPTPDKDFGYDITNYCDVDPRFGTLDDFDRLVRETHRLGMRIIIDMVMNHTSDQHPWFLASRASRTDPRRDWYIWQSSPGSRRPPNNWQACFGGKAWTFDPETGQHYLHLFTPEQPDVNWRNPSVRQAQLDAFRFWLERGVDGFRLDVFNAYFKDSSLRDNPLKFGLRAFERQYHIYDMDQPEMMPLLHELRRLLDSYPARYAVGETYLATLPKTLSYCGPDKLHAAFSFDFTSYNSEILTALRFYPISPRWIMRQILAREAAFKAAGVFPTTVLSNHDLTRAASRYIRGEDDRKAKVLMALLLTLRGTPFIYQGEEIAMRDVPLKYTELQDPPGKKYFPIYPGRDGCRSPMQWDDTPHAGFSTAQPWLKVHSNSLRRNVAAQANDPASILNFTKRLIAVRKSQSALRCGDFFPVAATRHVFVFLRSDESQSILVALNFTSRPRTLSLPAGMNLGVPLLTDSDVSTSPSNHTLHLAPFQVALWMVEK